MSIPWSPMFNDVYVILVEFLAEAQSICPRCEPRHQQQPIIEAVDTGECAGGWFL